MSALEYFKEMMDGLYKYMNDVVLNIFGVKATLWDLYLYGVLAGIAVFVYFKFIRS